MANQYDARRRKIERDRALAAAIRASGNEPLPASRQTGGRFDAPVSGWEHAARAVDKVLAGWQDRQANKAERQLDEEQAAEQQKWIDELEAAQTPDELQPIESTGELITPPTMADTLRAKLREITSAQSTGENEISTSPAAPSGTADPQQVFQQQQARQLSAANTFEEATKASDRFDRRKLMTHALKGTELGGVPAAIGANLVERELFPKAADIRYQDIGDKIAVVKNGQIVGYLPKGATPDAAENRKAAEAARRQSQEFQAEQSELSRRQAADIAAANRDLTRRGQDLTAANASGKVTDTQRSAKGYHDRMTESEKVLPAAPMNAKDWAAGRAILSASDGIGGSIKAGLANSVMSASGQKTLQAQMDWVRAKLRKESGAVIGNQEMLNEISTYFPMPGDSTGVIAQKKKARATAVNAMREQSGNAGDAASDDGWSATETK